MDTPAPAPEPEPEPSAEPESSPVVEPEAEFDPAPSAEPESADSVSKRVLAKVDTRVVPKAMDSRGNDLKATGNLITVSEGQESLRVNIPVVTEENTALKSFTDAAGLTFENNTLVIPTATSSPGDHLLIQISDEIGDIGTKLIIETGNAVGGSEGAVAEVKNIKSNAGFTHKDLSPQNPLVGVVSSTVALDLKTLPQNASVKITTTPVPDPEASSAFQLAAADARIENPSIAYTISVEKTNLENGIDIQRANITMVIGPEWVEANGGIEAIKIFRYDPRTGQRQVLETHFLGYDSQRRAMFEGVSPDGLSIFGLIGSSKKETEFSISQISANPDQVEANKPVTVSCTVKNNGKADGSYSAEMKINGLVETSSTVDIPAGGSVLLSFEVARDTAGTYEVEIGGQRTRFIVSAPSSPTDNPPSQPPTGTDDQTRLVDANADDAGTGSSGLGGWWILIGCGIGAGAIALILLRRRDRSRRSSM